MAGRGPLTVIGRVAELWRYPIKAMAPEALRKAELSWYGTSGDRRWALVSAGNEARGLSWLTLRERPDLCRYIPHLTDAEHPDRSSILVQCPDGTVLEATHPRLAERFGEGCRIMRLTRGTHDAMPISIITTATVSAVGHGSGTTPDARRFRPNLVIEAAEGRPFTEDDWVGRSLAIGEVVLRVDRPNKRCVVVNVDPQTGEPNPAVLRFVARQRVGMVGVYASAATPGWSKVGEPVRLLR